MGISGLLPFLQKSSRRGNVKEYSGATVAIDAYCWLHKGAFGCAEKLVMKEPTTMYVAYCMKYVNMLLSHNIKPILVFDGQNLPAKEQTEVKRRQNREVNRRKGMDLIRAGRVAEGRNVLRRALDVTHEMALEVMKECRRRNVDCIVAPYEADSQLAYLNLQGIAHVVITEDSDLTLFGCKTIMFKMDMNGNGVIVESSKLHLSMGLREDLFNLEKFRLMCILSGCDYIDSLPGIGLSKACKFVSRTSETDIYKALKKLPANLNMWALEISDSYRQGVVSADLTFRCQLVFDPLQRRQVPLTEPREGENIVGEIKDSATAMQLALGNLHPKSLMRLDSFDPDKFPSKPMSRTDAGMRAPHRSIWDSNYRRSALPQNIPTILRNATSGKIVETAFQFSPAVKREAEDLADEDDNREDTDLLRLYGGVKRPKNILSGSLQCSRYFGSSQSESETSASTNTEQNSLNQSCTENSLLTDAEEVDLFLDQENSLPLEDSSPSVDSSGSVTRLTSVLECMENIAVEPSSSEGSESACPAAIAPLSPTEVQPPSPVCNTPVTKKLPFKVCSEKKSPNSTYGLKLFDTVGTDKSVFFSGSPNMPMTVKGGKLRTGLSRRKTGPQQASLSQFGFKIGSPKKKL